MELEILLATMNQKNDSVLETMNVQSNIIVCNQNAELTSYEKYTKPNYNVRWYNFEEKGVGLNRNNALFRSTADICLLSDDDIVFLENYKKTILDTFEKNPKVDVVIFNLYDENNKKDNIKKKKRVHSLNCGRFGAVRIAFRRLKIIKNSICFNQLFGGGAMFTAGEDTMFLRDCLKKKLKVIAVPDCILKLSNCRRSTWFNGFDQKFFEDMGSSYCRHYGAFAFIFSILQLIKSRKRFGKDFSFLEKLRFIKVGIKRYKTLK